MKPIRSTFVLPLLLCASFLNAQPCAEMEQLYQSTYRFRPSAFPGGLPSQKSDALEQFWTYAGSRKAEGIRCVRSLLLGHVNDPYFQYDGATLLYTLDKGPLSLNAIAQALSHTEIAEVPAGQYLEFCTQLSAFFLDIGPMSLAFATAPNVDAKLQQEGSSLNRLTGSLLLFGSMIPSIADTYLARALHSPSRVARATAMQMMAFLRTEQSLRILDSLYKIFNLPDSISKLASSFNQLKLAASTPAGSHSRESIRALLTQVPLYDVAFPGFATDQSLVADAISLLLPDDVALVREARRRSVTGANDKSLNEFYALTNILNGLFVRHGLFVQYRSW